MSAITSLLQLLGVLPSFLILAASIVILVKTRSAAGVLMVVGESLIILMSIFNIVWLHRFQQMSSSTTMEYANILTISHAISILGVIVFGVGLLILALKLNRK